MEPLPALIQDFDKAEWEECFRSFGARGRSCVIMPARISLPLDSLQGPSLRGWKCSPWLGVNLAMGA